MWLHAEGGKGRRREAVALKAQIAHATPTGNLAGIRTEEQASWTVNKRDNLSYFHLIVNVQIANKTEPELKLPKLSEHTIRLSKYIYVCVWQPQIINVKLALTNWQSQKAKLLRLLFGQSLICWFFFCFSK